MTTAIAELNELTTKSKEILSSGFEKFKCPKDVLEKRVLYHELSLPGGENLLMRARHDHLKSLGFKPMLPQDAVTALCGKQVIKEWLHDRDEMFWDRVSNKNYYFRRRYYKVTRWWWTDGVYSMAPASSLLTPVPYGVALLVHECRKTDLFDGIVAVGPQEAFAKPQPIDPVLLGLINGDTEQSYFFLAKW